MSFAVATAIFLALLLSLSLPRTTVGKLIKISFFTALVGGLIYYSLAFGAEVESVSDIPAAAFKALAGTAEMFTGNDHFDDITVKGMWVLENPASRAVFWFLHVLAVYATTSALLSILGKELIRRIRYKFRHFEEVYVFYHVTEDGLRLAGEIEGKKPVRLLFIDDAGDSEKEDKVRDAGGFIIDEDSFISDKKGKWLRHAGIKKNGRHLMQIICLADDDPANKIFLHAVREKLGNAGIPARYVKISIRTNILLQYGFLMNSKDPDGEVYNIHVYTPWDMTARMAMTAAPLYKTVEFDSNCSARSDVKVLILGFGHMGQEIYRHLIMNGQFLGSKFHAVVADRNIESCRACFEADYPKTAEYYDTEFRQMDIPSAGFTSLLANSISEFDYIAVCCGRVSENDSVIEMIRQYKYAHPTMCRDKSILIQCCRTGIMVYDCITDKDGNIITPFSSKPSYVSDYDSVRDVGLRSLSDENVTRSRLDRMAYAVNAVYAGQEGEDPETSWQRLDYYSRASSRASADFVPAVLAAAGVDEKYADEKYFADMKADDPDKLTQLGKLEHIRWNAFQIASGVVPMSTAEMRARASDGASSIQKDIPDWIIGGRHACITGWDDLDALSDEYSRLTGKKTDYKLMDINNVMNIPKILEIYNGLK